MVVALSPPLLLLVQVSGLVALLLVLVAHEAFASELASAATRQDAPFELAVTSFAVEQLEDQAPHERTGPARIVRAQYAPQVLQVREPKALWIALNVRECHLLRGDRLELRGNGEDRTVVVTTANASLAERAWKTASFWDHPFLFRGNAVAVTYIASIPTLMLPIPAQAHARPVVAIDSYVFAYRARWWIDDGSSNNSSALNGSDLVAPEPLESIVGGSSELREAVCFKKREPMMYAKAKAVARLLIRRQTRSSASPPSSSGAVSAPSSWHHPQTRKSLYCTGWLVGRGNHVLTNYHCIATLPLTGTRVRDGSGSGDVRLQSPPLPRRDREAAPRLRPSGSSSSLSSSASMAVGADLPASSSSGTLEAATANFMAETKRCSDTSSIGAQLGVIEATSAVVVASNPALDYALLRLQPNDTSVDLARKYGYLQLRPTGPVDGEAVYIPQHPNGEAKEIAATKNGRAAVIRLFPTQSPLVDTDASAASMASSSVSTDRSTGANNSAASSGGSLRRGTSYKPVNPNVFHNADTRPGSSGSPVLSQRDHTVVALHHAGGTAPIAFPSVRSSHTVVGDHDSSSSSSAGSARSSSADADMADYNSGIRIDLVIEDLRLKRALPFCALARTCSRVSSDPCCRTKW